MDIVRTFIGVYCLQIYGMAQNVVLLRNAVTAVDIAGRARNIERLPTIIPLHE